MTQQPAAGGASLRRPELLVFDVNETLSDMTPVSETFAQLGLPRDLATIWFAGLLRDGFALTAVRAGAPFAEIGAESLRGLLHGRDLPGSVDEAVRQVMDAFMGLQTHPDVVDGVRRLANDGLRLVTLSNGATAVADGLFERAGIRDQFEELLSVEAVGLWKPAPEAYAYALEHCGVRAEKAMLVAVHPWDIDGASRAGLLTAWVNRTGAPYPGYFQRPSVEVESLTDLADQLR